MLGGNPGFSLSFLVTVANRAKEDREGFVLMTVVNRVRRKPDGREGLIG